MQTRAHTHTHAQTPHTHKHTHRPLLASDTETIDDCLVILRSCCCCFCFAASSCLCLAWVSGGLCRRGIYCDVDCVCCWPCYCCVKYTHRWRWRRLQLLSLLCSRLFLVCCFALSILYTFVVLSRNFRSLCWSPARARTHTHTQSQRDRHTYTMYECVCKHRY